ncbi:MAG: NAD(P)-dependent oxidoreductase [Victivallaceae bacterium]
MNLEQLRNKKIFLSGGTGFFGKSILDYLNRAVWNGHLYILSRNPDNFCKKNPELIKLPGLNFVQGDIRNFNYSSLPDFDYAIQAATETHSGLAEEKPDEMYSVIVEGTKYFLEMCAQKNVSRLLYVSSGAVYGIQPPELPNIPESRPCAPVNVYGQGKFDAENICLASQTDTVIARCFAFVGPFLPLDKHFAIGNFINNILNGEDISILGDGTPYRSYMYADDLVEWLLTFLLNGRSNEPYNVGSDEPISIVELAEQVLKFSQSKKAGINIAKEKVDGVLSSRYVPSTKKALKELGLKCRISLSESIKRTINSHGK